MSQCKTQADCFRELARVMDMSKDTKLAWQDCIKLDGSDLVKTSCNFPAFTIREFSQPSLWSFAIAIVEDKPVFIGDTLYFMHSCLEAVEYMVHADDNLYTMYRFKDLTWNPSTTKKPVLPEGFIPHNGRECPVEGDTIVDLRYSDGEGRCGMACDWQWSGVIGYKIIKPATVMVELSVRYAEFRAGWSGLTIQMAEEEGSIFDRACRKALEERNKK